MKKGWNAVMDAPGKTHKKKAGTEKPHDRGYKYLFSHPKMVEDLIRSFVKKDFVREIDFTTLKRKNASYVTNELKEQADDIIWEVKIQGKPAYFYFLIEFQSTVDRFMAVRILCYILLFYIDLVKEKGPKPEKLPAVFPVLLYSGEGRWSAPVNIDRLIETPFKSLASYVPRFQYYRIVENEFSKKSLLKLNNLVSRLFLIETSEPEKLAKIVNNAIMILKKEVNPGLKRDFGIWLRRIPGKERH